MSKQIGIFDSGIGGLSILKALLHAPGFEFVYVADTAYLPYGQQPTQTLIKQGKLITQFFLDREITTIIVACHTSSATTLPTLQETFPQVTFIDMLAPTITKAAQTTHNNKIGVFATPATITSGVHKQELLKVNPALEVIEQPCPKLVPLIEADDQPKLIKTVAHYLKPMERAGVDTLILGCTHYAFIADRVKQLAPQIKLVSAHLEAQNLFETDETKITKVTFFASGDLDEFKNDTTRILPTLMRKFFNRLV